MAQYMFSTAQRVFIYDSYVLTQSARQVQIRFAERFPGEKVPGRTTIHNLYKKFQATGSVQSKKPNRHRRVLTEEILDDIGHRMENSPQKSLRHLSQQTGISYGSVQRATKLLKLKQYKITDTHTHQPGQQVYRYLGALSSPPTIPRNYNQKSEMAGKSTEKISNPIECAVRTKLTSHLEPVHMDILNESFMHNVPPGSETHFKVVVISDKFNNVSLIKRHRMVNEILKDELQNGIHALSIVAKTPSQWEESAKTVSPSPACRGGFGK